MIAEFLDFLFGTEQGRVYAPVNTATGFERNHTFAWPGNREGLIKHIETSASRGDVYVAPALFRNHLVSKQSFRQSGVVWVDFDGNLPQDFSLHGVPKPSWVIQSSTSENAHCYWKLEKPVTDPYELEGINRGLAYAMDADKSGWDCTQLLRPPGTINHKNGLPVSTRESNQFKYPASQFEAHTEKATINLPQQLTLLDPDEYLKASPSLRN